MKNKPLISIGIIFGSYDLKYLPYSLKSIFEQTYVDFELLMHNNVIDEADVEADDKVCKWIEQNYPNVKIVRTGNIGFGSGHNEMIRRMKGDYYLCYNPDLILEPDFLERMVKFWTEYDHEGLGVLGGRIMFWDFDKRNTPSGSKTNTIDSLGLSIKKSHRFYEIGQGSDYTNELNVNVDEVFGLSGALFMASRQALEDVSYDFNGRKEYFDESIFLYKEDVDLAYRFKLAGYNCYILHDAVAYHDRSIHEHDGMWVSRKKKRVVRNGQSINTWSFYHHHIVLYKLWQSGFSIDVKLKTIIYELISNGYALIFEFNTFWNTWKLFNKNFVELKFKKGLTFKKVSASEIERWMK